MLRNLQAEMVRNGVTSSNLASAIKKTDRSVRDKLAGKSYFGIDEAINIRDAFFPGMTLEYLFAQESASPSM